MSILLSSTLANETSPYYALANAVGGGVTQIVAGTNVTLSPSGGTGAVTVNATATGVTQIVAGTNVTLSPAGGTGAVTVNATAGFFTGMIIPWVGVSPAPAGWAICDGTTPGVPNLQDRFIIGASATYPFGSSGGAASTLLTLNMIPDHYHVGAVLSSAAVASGAGGSTVNPTAETGAIANPGYVAGTPVPTLPPYYSLTYIMKL